MTVSWWRRDPHPAIIRTDVLIVGAGVAGLCCAREVLARGGACLVLERERVGSGASTRNAGFLMRGAADNYAAAVRDHGRERAQLLWRWTEENLALLRADGIEALPSYSARPSCLLSLSPEEETEVRASHELLARDGFDSRWVERGSDDAWRTARAGLVNPHDAVVNPVHLLGLLRAPLGDRIIEGAEVCAMEREGTEIVLRTAHARFAAPRVIFCTNAYTDTALPALRGYVAPRRGQMLALLAPGLRLEMAYYANHGSEYFRAAGDGVVVVGGCRTYHADVEAASEDRTTSLVQHAIEAFATSLFGRTFPVVARWAGIMGFSPDGLPLVGAVPGEPGVFFCGGFTGHGMSLARRCAKAAVAEALDGTPSPFGLSRAVAARHRES
ncbi:MAG: FAD-binding oxidoreductase [Phycisphaerales bacterium]|nr:FAD-binding oxidoreductase [Phycisphaerales bacterium]